jgi:hypothetical protein
MFSLLTSFMAFSVAEALYFVVVKIRKLPFLIRDLEF